MPLAASAPWPWRDCRPQAPTPRRPIRCWPGNRISHPRQAGYFSLHARRRQPGRFLRLQAPARKRRRQKLFLRRRPSDRQHRQTGCLRAARDETPVEIRPATASAAAGLPISSRKSNRHVDDLCFLHSLHTEGIAHGPATLFLHCGSTNFIRPSVGSWILYGLGTENANLPGFVSIAPSPGNGGPRNYGNAFLPAVYQGTAVGKAGGPAAQATMRNLTNPKLSSLPTSAASSTCCKQLNAEQLKKNPGDSELEAVISSYELAWRMQSQRPGRARHLARNQAKRRRSTASATKATDNFGRQCLLAPRLCEAGVRYRAGHLRRQHRQPGVGPAFQPAQARRRTPGQWIGRSPGC